MSSPTLLQQNENPNTSSLAFTDPVNAGSFLLAVCRDAQSLSVSDNVNGAWTPLLTGELQSTLPYTIAYLPVSQAGTITVATSPSNTSLTVAEISTAVLRAYSVVNSGTISGTSAVEFTSANVAALTGDLLLGYAITTGSNVQSAGGSYVLQAVGVPPVAQALETQDAASSGNYASDFITPANRNGQVWGTGLLALYNPTAGGSNNAGLLRLLGVS